MTNHSYSPNFRLPDADGDGRAATAGAGDRPVGLARPSLERRPLGTGSRRTLCQRRKWHPCRCAPNLSQTWPWFAGATTAFCSGTGPADASSDASRTAGEPSPRPRRQTSGAPPVPLLAFYTAPATRSGLARFGSASMVGRAITPPSCTPAKRDT